jgi:hypothetical protein
VELYPRRYRGRGSRLLEVSKQSGTDRDLGTDTLADRLLSRDSDKVTDRGKLLIDPYKLK